LDGGVQIVKPTFVRSVLCFERRLKPYKKMRGENNVKKEEAKQEEKQENLLLKLCGNDAKLYEFLGEYLLEHPSAGIAQKGFDTLIEDAEKSGNFRTEVDKAIFEVS
jgi:hypothetical protein